LLFAGRSRHLMKLEITTCLRSSHCASSPGVLRRASASSPNQDLGNALWHVTRVDLCLPRVNCELKTCTVWCVYPPSNRQEHSMSQAISTTPPRLAPAQSLP
jgi:hypothetical protein